MDKQVGRARKWGCSSTKSVVLFLLSYPWSVKVCHDSLVVGQFKAKSRALVLFQTMSAFEG